MTPTPDTELMAVAWLHTMHQEGWQKIERVSHTELDPFGKQGVNYDSSHHVTSEPLFRHRIASTRPDSALMDDLTKLANYADHADLGRADRDVIAAIYSRMSEALRQSPPRADDALPVEARLVETVQTWPPGEPGEPFWRIEIDGYCADFDHEGAAKNFASRINYLIHRKALASEPQLRADDALRDLLRQAWVFASRGEGWPSSFYPQVRKALAKAAKP